MGANSRHAAGRRPARKRGSRRRPARRLTGLMAVAAASAVVVTAAAVASARSPGVRIATFTWSAAGSARTAAAPKAVTDADAAERTGQVRPGRLAAAPLPRSAPTLTVRDRKSCPAAATACVDLTRHLTWLQSGGLVSFGPVRMEPGPPGTRHATPRGTFQVTWKGGPALVSNIYGDPMPWAVFFAPGGIAFHGGSLTQPSHGCVHLTVPDARYYNTHLQLGAEVVVF